MSRPRTSARLAIATITLCAAVAGCGGSSSVSPNSYVKSVCSAVGAFEKDVQSRSSALNLSGLTSAAQGKQALQGFMSAAVADSEKAVSGLKAAGTPDVGNGMAISAAVVSAFTQLKTALAGAQAQTNALPTNSPSAFKTGAESLSANIRSSFTGIGSSLKAFKSPSLEKAAKSTPACQRVG